MRTISEPVRDWLNKKVGVEPQLVVGVKWKDDREVYYSSHDVSGALKNVVSITGVDTTVDVNNTAGSQTATVTLSDTDGELTKILNTIDPHKRPAKVYLHFPGVPLDMSVAVIEGEINSPIEWDDRARTLQFTILSKIEGRQFGFATEEGKFRLIDSQTRSEAWPFRFGTTCSYPTTRVRTGVKGFLKEGQGVADPTLGTRICQVRQIVCPDVFVNVYSGDVYYTKEELQRYIQSLDVPTEMTVRYEYISGPGSSPGGGTTAEAEDRFNTYWEAIDVRPGKEPECLAAKSSLLCQLLRDKATQEKYVSDTLEISGGERFPQNTPITIRIKDVRFEGTMDGETFTITKTLRQDVTLQGECGPIPDFAYGYRLEKVDDPQSVDQCQRDPVYPTKTGNLFESKVGQYDLGVNLEGAYARQPVGGAGAGFRVVQEGQSVPFKWLPAGTDVFLEQSSEVVAIVSAVPGTVTQVSAYRTFGDNRILTVVPADRYEVFFTIYGDLQVTELRMDKPLSEYPDEDWDDEVFVSFVSDVGPNPTDVIEWIVDTFTDYTVDATNFAAISTKLANYPCNAFLDTREDALRVIADIAREARCAVRVADGVISLVYLPEEPDAVRTIGKADVVAGSLSFDLTETENLYTSHKVSYKETGTSAVEDDPDEKTFSIQRNVDKYGFTEREETYVTINNEAQAVKTATFWAIREANAYRRVKFQTTLQHLDLEVFDCVNLDVGVFPETKVVIESVKYNPDSSLLEFTAWTPILAGTNEEYFWAWPAGKPAGIPYPTSKYELEDPRLNVFPPEGHPLHVPGPDPASQATLGDEFPSDLDDTFPVTDCRISTDYVVIDEVQPQFDRPSRDFSALAQKMDQVNAAQGGGTVGDDGEREPREVEGCGTLMNGTECTYYVILTYVTPELIATTIGANGCLSAGPCVSNPEDQVMPGLVCSGPLDQECYTFANLTAADNFWIEKFNEANQNKRTCNYNLGERKLFQATSPAVAFTKNAAGEVCNGSNDPEIDDYLYAPGSGGVGST